MAKMTTDSISLFRMTIGSHRPHVSGLRWTEFLLGLRKIEAPVILLMDTCHSAGVTGVNQTIKDASDPRHPLNVLVSCPSNQVSFEDPKWGHGAFTLAVLEAIGGQKRDSATVTDLGQARGGTRLGGTTKPAVTIVVPLPDANGNGSIDLGELQRYVIARVGELTDGRQQPKAYPKNLPGNLKISDVPSN
ncbi:MAG: putative caspase-like protein [Verrucomicrobiales bacterium]|jgi:uncharacterized caspase-like protein